jgi:hypothetical protein
VKKHGAGGIAAPGHGRDGRATSADHRICGPRLFGLIMGQSNSPARVTLRKLALSTIHRSLPFKRIVYFTLHGGGSYGRDADPDQIGAVRATLLDPPCKWRVSC